MQGTVPSRSEDVFILSLRNNVDLRQAPTEKLQLTACVDRHNRYRYRYIEELGSSLLYVPLSPIDIAQCSCNQSH